MTMPSGPVDLQGYTEFWREYYIYDIDSVGSFDWGKRPGNYVIAY